jgi:predicted nucleic acid-binding protein
MTRLKIVVSDASVLMDLAKVRLIEATLALPFDFVIPETIFLKELIDLGSYSSDDLLRLGFRAGALEPDDAELAFTYFRTHRRVLSVNDCFAWRFAEVHGGILMTGDADLRAIATKSGVEVHGTLWVAELIHEHQTCSRQKLVDALDQFAADPFVFLPAALLRALKAKLTRKA